ncbi:biopolymer transporter ExbD [Ferruginibacter lapsinanis]|uniref:ExbD/TolR family protein n=1 Tax=Ferruginibacter lapsinanis TaxID=563172 RepID=UPI001E41A13A|nr:biopolymer transporter ExbD [Ferruginibacter lapsinanis]UEG50002.1 biopolymer transporter ExbD [Ferruginibacter lapsinanis]
MGRAKIPRKSTTIDMTAMCDVAFLLLSFFILATKQKPPEAVTVAPPSSVSSKAAPEKSILITLTKEGKCFLMLGDETKKTEILNDINTTRGLGLSGAEISKLKKLPFIGMPLGQIKGILALDQTIPPDKLSGIPIADSANNELVDWIRSVTNAYAGGDQRELEEKILIKGDQMAKYPAFTNIKYALKKNDIFKFRIVTNGEAAPIGSELYNNNKLGVDATGEKK